MTVTFTWEPGSMPWWHAYERIGPHATVNVSMCGQMERETTGWPEPEGLICPACREAITRSIVEQST